MSRLSRRKAAAKKRIGRQQKSLSAIYKQQKQAKGLSGIMDFAGSVANLGTALAPNLQEWKEFETGREAVGMERSDADLNLFDKVGRAFKGPELTDTHDVWGSGAPGGGGALQQGHQYSTAELKRIGMERMAGTERETLGDGQWSDLLGKSMGERMDPSWKPSSGMKASQGINTLGTSQSLSDPQSMRGKQWLERDNISQGEFGSSKMGMMEGGGFLDKFKSQLREMSSPFEKGGQADVGQTAYKNLSNVNVVGDIAPKSQEDTTTKANMMLQMDTPATPGSSNLLGSMQQGEFGKTKGFYDKLEHNADFSSQQPTFLDIDAFGTGDTLKGTSVGKMERPYDSASDIIGNSEDYKNVDSMTDDSYFDSLSLTERSDELSIAAGGTTFDKDGLFTDDDVLGNPQMGDVKDYEVWDKPSQRGIADPSSSAMKTDFGDLGMMDKVGMYMMGEEKWDKISPSARKAGVITSGQAEGYHSDLTGGEAVVEQYYDPSGDNMGTGRIQAANQDLSGRAYGTYDKIGAPSIGEDLQKLGQGAKDIFGGALDKFRNAPSDLSYGFNMWKATGEWGK